VWALPSMYVGTYQNPSANHPVTSSFTIPKSEELLLLHPISGRSRSNYFSL